MKPGDVIAGKYVVDRQLGEGGMGIVVAATHRELGQKVALKFLQPAILGNQEVVERFLREARAGVQIGGENVARVLDVGRLETGSPYMVMEYLDGGDLDRLIASRGPLATTDAVDLLLQACLGVAEAHKHGIVHRDLKPANLFITTRSDGAPLVKVLDFGISKVVSADPNEASLTRTSVAMGSAHFMSPEQIRASRDVDVRTDVWALGVIAYQMLSAKLPFDAESAHAVLAKVLEAGPPALGQMRPDLPKGLVQVVERCMHKSRDQRFANVGELASALAPYASERGAPLARRVGLVLGVVEPSMRPLVATAASGPQPPTSSAFGGTRPAVPTSRAPLLAASGIVVAIGGIAAALVLGRPDEPSEEGAPAAGAEMPVSEPEAPPPTRAVGIVPVDSPPSSDALEKATPSADPPVPAPAPAPPGTTPPPKPASVPTVATPSKPAKTVASKPTAKPAAKPPSPSSAPAKTTSSPPRESKPVDLMRRR